jgi:glycosyltransferase involved in cell wall biosynthesis
MNKNFLSIVIPVYNEAGLLHVTLEEIRHQMERIEISHEIIIVDDGSTDGTWTLLCLMSQECPEVKAIRLSRNFGKESALAAGLSFASGNAVIVMDCDGQHPPDLIPEMIRIWLEEAADIVEGVKTGRGNEPLFSTLRARFFYWLMKRLTGLDLDNASDFKLVSRKVVDAHNSLHESTRFFRGIISWLGFRRVQIPFSVRERTTGQSRWSLIQLISLALRASTSFSSLPLHLITIMGTGTLIVSVILGMQTLYMKFSGAAVSGFTTVILLLLFIGSVLMLSIGIIGIYISRIFEEVKRRPKFIIDATTNLRGSD